jgi:hypothetical protein
MDRRHFLAQVASGSALWVATPGMAQPAKAPQIKPKPVSKLASKLRIVIPANPGAVGTKQGGLWVAL